MARRTNGWALGLGGSDHDYSAALMCGCDLKVAIEQERLSRTKNGLSVWYRDPLAEAVQYCLAAEGVKLSDVELVAASDTIPARTRAAFSDLQLKLYSHHLCHAASAYLMMPRGCTAGIFVYDGYGSILERPTAARDRAPRETFSFFLFSPEGHRRLGGVAGLSFREDDDFPIGISNSIGMLYEIVTCVLGYGPMDSGKTMGLAAYGTPKYLSVLKDTVRLGDSYADCFRCPTDSPELVEVVERILDAGRGGFEVRADLAASVQALVHKVLLHCVELLRSQQSVDHIGISGGCGLNTVANSALVEATAPGCTIMIPPHCGDAGLGLGALWLAAAEQAGRSPDLTFRGLHPAPGLARPGRLYSREDRDRAALAYYPRLSRDPSISAPADLAGLLADGEIIALFRGRSEIGPRALGGRSILADPRRVEVRETLNRVIKDREPFRPFGPVVLADAFETYFGDPRQADPYMLKVARTTERCRREAPAVVHVDGSARAQIVSEATDPFLFQLLQTFRDRTGLPILINTSFNRRGEPIVETPDDAIDAFLGLQLDGLYLDGEFYRQAAGAKPRR